MARPERQLDVAAQDALERMRALCLGLPETVEDRSYGNPSFKRGGKPFLVLDRYKGRDCLWLLVDPGRRPDMLAGDGWFASPHDPRERALCCALEKVDWEEMAALIATSHALAR